MPEIINRNNCSVVILLCICLLSQSVFAQWAKKNSGLNGGDVLSLAVNGSGHIFAGTNQKGIYRSTNNGTTWTTVNSGLPNPNVYALVTKGSDLFAGTFGGVHRSSDDGNSWTDLNTGMTANLVRCFVVKEGTKLFAGSDFDGVYFSANNGDSWTQVNTGLNNFQVHSLAVIGSNLFASTNGGIFLSANDGASWTAVNTGLTNLTVKSVIASGANLFAGTAGDGVFFSSNNGSSWTAVNSGLTNLNIISLLLNGTDLFAGTTGGVYHSNNSGASWTPVNNGLTNSTYVNSLTASGGFVFAGVNGVGIFQTNNNGASWSIATNGMENAEVNAFFSDGGNLFAATQSGVYLSTDEGGTWVSANSGLTNLQVTDFALNGGNLFVATYGGGVFLSTNNGGLWTLASTGLGNFIVMDLLFKGSNLFAATGSGIFVTSNNGTSWSAATTGLTNNNVTDLAVSDNNLFAATGGGGVFLSGNDGSSWTAVNSGLTSLQVTDLEVMGSDLFAAAAYIGTPGVYKSSDNGSNWVPAGFSGTNVTSLASNGNDLFAGTYSVVYISRDKGNVWMEFNEGFNAINPLTLNFHSGNLFAGAIYDGVWSRPLTDLTLASQPTDQPTNLTFTNLGSTSFTGNFDPAPGTPEGYLVLMSANVPPNIDPQDGVQYPTDHILGNNGGNNIYAVFSGSGTTFDIASLSPDTQLHFKIYAYNGGGPTIRYLTTAPLAESQKSLATLPVTQASLIVVNAITDNSVTLDFSDGAGSSRIVVGRESSISAAEPTDGIAYTGSATFGSGSQTGTGNYVVHTGSGPLTVTNLTAGTSYVFQVYEFSGSGGSENYLTTTATNNPLTIRRSWHVSTGGSDTNIGSPGSPFLTITKALTSAQTGDIIKVAAGTYQEGLTTQSKVVLMGGYATNFTEAGRDIFANKTTVLAISTVLLIEGHGSTIDGFFFDGNNTAETGLEILSSSVVSHNVIVRCKSSPGQGMHIGGSAMVVNNTFYDNISGVLIFGTNSATSIFKNNIVSGNIFGLNNSSASGIHSYNDVHGNSSNYLGNFASPGTGDISQNPMFVNVSAGDFRLISSSLAIDRGDPADPVGDEPSPNGGRIDMGAYGGTKLATSVVSEPTTPASGLSFGAITGNSVTVSFTGGSGIGRILVCRQGSAVNSDPVDGTIYTANSTFTSGSQIGTGNFVVGTASPVTVIGLNPSTAYHFRVYEFNGSAGSENYLLSTATDNPRSVTTTTSSLATEPANQPTALNLTPAALSLAGSFTAAVGSPAGYLVIMGTGVVPDTPPSDGASYSINQNLGNGKVVHTGPATTFNVTGLTPSTAYHFNVFSFNGNLTATNYLITAPLQNNTTTLTLAGPPTTQPSNFTFEDTQSSTLTINWQPGDGKTLIIAREGAAVDKLPGDGVTLTANNVFESPNSHLGDGNYVIYNGNGNSMSLTGLEDGATFHFRTFAYNGNPGTENYLITPAATFSRTKSVFDSSVPSVSHTTVASVASGQPVTISVNITDSESAITSATVQFRSISASGNLTPRALTQGTGSSYSAQVTAAEIGELGIEYKIFATSAGGTYNDQFFKTIKVTMPAGSSLAIPYSSFGSSVSNYRIVAVPLELDSKSVGSVFNELAPADPKKWRIYHYENGSNKELNTNSLIETGKGYWLIVKENPGEAIVAGSGSTVQTSTDDPYSINLTAGWNQIGNPYNFKLSWDDMQTANSGLPDIIRTYDGNFADDDRLDIMEGGFVNVTTARTIVFPVVKNTSLGRKKDVKKQWQNPIDQNNWQVYITLSEGERSNRISGFGMHENASESRDEFDGLTMPRFFGEHLEVNHHKRSGNDHFSKDIVPTSENYTWEFDIDTNLESKVMTFSWDNSYFGDNEKSLVLWNAAQQIGIDMRTSNSYTFEKDRSRTFRVFFGSAEEVKERSMASRFVFHSVSPNPADGDVVISFSVPKDADQSMVEAEIYDLMGRKTWHHQAQFGAGYQQLAWRIEDQDAPGIYIIQLKQGSATEQKRIIIKSN